MSEIKKIEPITPVYVVEVRLTQSELNTIVSELARLWIDDGLQTGGKLYSELWPYYKLENK